MTLTNFPRLSLLPILAATLLVFGACGDDETATGASGGQGPGGGTAQGGSGGGAVVPGARATCETGPPTGGTPNARSDAAAAFSQDGLELMVFGGDTATVVCGNPPVREHVGETWILDTACGEWTDVGAGPPARARHVAVSDIASNRAFIFGGRTRTAMTGPYTLFNDVWSFDFASRTWAEVTTTGTGPSPRANTAGAVVGNELFIFGGNTSTDGLNFQPQGDFFALNLDTSTWRAITATGPSARLFHAAASDPASGLFFVGMGGLGSFNTDVWAFDTAAETWTELNAPLPAGATEGRFKLGMAVRPAVGASPASLYVVAGHDDGQTGNRNDILALELPSGAPTAWGALNWTKSVGGDTFNKPANAQCDFPADFTNVDMNAFERRSGFAVASSPDGQAFVTFGGDSDCGRLNDAWWFNASLGTLENIRPTLIGLTCPRTGNTNCGGLCG